MSRELVDRLDNLERRLENVERMVGDNEVWMRVLLAYLTTPSNCGSILDERTGRYIIEAGMKVADRVCDMVRLRRRQDLAGQLDVGGVVDDGADVEGEDEVKGKRGRRRRKASEGVSEDEDLVI